VTLTLTGHVGFDGDHDRVVTLSVRDTGCGRDTYAIHPLSGLLELTRSDQCTGPV
jgi:hypothetical protein